jgi:hypothetical protein
MRGAKMIAKKIPKFVQTINRAIKSFTRETDKNILAGFVTKLNHKDTLHQTIPVTIFSGVVTGMLLLWVTGLMI